MNSGVSLWEKAKGVIPGGNQLLSKRSERFLPGQWPSYYSKASGCEVWDLDDNHYYDFAQMGVGCCVLGYCHPFVDERVRKAIAEGSMCSLNCPEEVVLAEKLLELHPWAEMVRFSRTGGEACSIAVRIARAATGRDRVLFCGYHGWHDWYISANIGDSSNLDDQLLPGLSSRGVPRQLADTAVPFSYNDFVSLMRAADSLAPDRPAAIIMEAVRNHLPKPGFLQQVRQFATKIGAVLIFDEVTSGFRTNVGGIHLTYDVTPDMAVFGKAMANGYPISAIAGTRSVMDAAQESFISSTFWTERIGFAAALASIDVMQREDVPKALVSHGERINNGWRRLAIDCGVSLSVSGIPPLTHMSFDYPNALAVQTLYCQEMLKAGYLAGAAVYTTHAYTTGIIDSYLEAARGVFATVAESLSQNDVIQRLEGGVMHPGFARLT